MTNQQAIEVLKLNNPFMAGKDKETFSKAIDKGIEALENQKTGHWIKHEKPNLGQCMKISYECSNCKVWLGCEYFIRKSYCPNCGAEMEGDK